MELTPEIAEICGIHAGDGYLRTREKNKGEIDISGHIEEKEYYDNHIAPLFNKVFNLKLKAKEFPKRSSYGIVIYQKHVRDSLINLGFPNGKKSELVKVPKQILKNKNKNLYTKFLRGLFDTDGNLYFRKSYAGINQDNKKYNHYPIIKITTISKDLAEGTIKMLNELEINFNYHNKSSKKINEKRKHIINISGTKNLKEWIKIIGIKNNAKYSRYLIWKKFGFYPPNINLTQREDILKGKLDPYSIGLVM